MSEVIEAVFEAGLEVGGALVEDENDAREDFASPGAGVGLRTETDLPGDERGAQCPLREVVVGRDVAIVGPAIRSLGVAGEDVRDAMQEGGSRAGAEGALCHTGWRPLIVYGIAPENGSAPGTNAAYADSQSRPPEMPRSRSRTEGELRIDKRRRVWLHIRAFT